jgi:predicted DNA-binding protein
MTAKGHRQGKARSPTMSVTMPVDYVERLGRVADHLGVTVSAVIRMAVLKYLKTHDQ